MVRLRIRLYNSLDLEQYYNSINNSSNKASISILGTYYNQNHRMKLKDLEEL